MGGQERREHLSESPEPTEKPAQEQHLPQIGEKPIVPRRKRFIRVGMVVSGAIFVTAAAGFRLLQHYEPGPKPIYTQTPATQSLASLAIAKGFPEQCLQPYIDLTSPEEPTPDPHVERLECIYRGHPNGQPVPSDACEVTLERNTWSDPYNFSFTVAVSDSDPVYMGKGSQFSDILTIKNVSSACAQENIDYP